jgi:hypothetical protein
VHLRGISCICVSSGVANSAPCLTTADDMGSSEAEMHTRLFQCSSLLNWLQVFDFTFCTRDSVPSGALWSAGRRLDAQFLPIPAIAPIIMIESNDAPLILTTGHRFVIPLPMALYQPDRAPCSRSSHIRESFVTSSSRKRLSFREVGFANVRKISANTARVNAVPPHSHLPILPDAQRYRTTPRLSSM